MIIDRSISFISRLRFRKTVKYPTRTIHSFSRFKCYYLPEVSARRLITTAEHIRKTSIELNEESVLQHNTSAAITSNSSSISKTIQSEISLSELFSLISKRKDTLDENILIQFLRQTASLYCNIKSDLTLDDIKNSEEFLILLRNFQKYSTSLNRTQIIDALQYLETLKISRKSAVVYQLLRVLKKDFSNLDFHQAVFLYQYVKVIEEDAAAAFIKSKLEVALPAIFKQSFNQDDVLQVKNALSIAICDVLPNKTIDEIMKATYRLCDLKGIEFSQDVVKDLLKFLKKPNLKYSTFFDCKMRTFTILKKVWEKVSVNDLKYIFTMYSSLVSTGLMEYDAGVIERMTNVLLQAGQDPVEKFLILQSLNRMRHIHNGILDDVVDFLINDAEILGHEAIFSEILIQSLAQADYSNEKPEKWEKLKPIIENLSYLDNESNWSDFDVDLASQLVSLGIFKDKILNYLSDKYNNEEFVELHLRKVKPLLALNQAVKLWHSEFQKPLISDEFVSNFVKSRSVAKNKKNYWASEVGISLENTTGVKFCFLKDRFTDGGYMISGIMALNNENQPIPFHGINKLKTATIEEIKPLIECKTMLLVLLIGQNSYSANTSQLRELPSITLNTLKDLGYNVLLVLEHEWKELRKVDRGPYLWDRIKDKVENTDLK